MANGKRLDPHKMIAASRTLPLGTTARVTNLRNGRSAEVRVEDRGPYVRGRVIDVTPQVAEILGMKEDGISPVEIRPLAVPQPNGEMKWVSN
jgi:rare lipoprotein A